MKRFLPFPERVTCAEPFAQIFVKFRPLSSTNLNDFNQQDVIYNGTDCQDQKSTKNCGDQADGWQI
jgi:hypothetical protein